MTACGGDDGPTAVERIAGQRAEQAQKAARDAGLSPDVQRFLAQAARAVAATFTVAYDDGGVRTTLTQRPPARRVDVTKDGATESLLRLRDGTYACTAQGCKKQDRLAGIDPDLGVFAPSRLTEAIDALAAAKDGFRFEVAKKTVAGVGADCLVTTPVAGGDADELCIAPTGAIVRIHSAARSLEAVAYSASADPAVLKTP